ncbi:hypothetical protein ABZ883_38500 [Streptomyces sp. NPDC046977]|uniref:hypothetical protein n=1 Tax=Streptomyces sp. NPDC046977 TaxID=3154703 RepID=UPI0033CECA29
MVIPSPFRLKGGGPLLGADAPGRPGPFGIREDTRDDGPQPEPSLRPVLEQWLRKAGPSHPVHILARESGPGPGAALDVLESLLGTFETASGGQDRELDIKRGDFAALTTMGALLDTRAELVVATSVTAAGIGFHLGNTKIANPDLILARGPAPGVGIEVTARAPQNIAELCERLETDILALHPGWDAKVVFSSYPSRLTAAVTDQVIAAVSAAHQSALSQARSGAEAEVPVDDRKNGAPLTVTVQLGPGSGRTRWEVSSSELTDPLTAAEYAVFDAGRGAAKAAQGRSLGAPVVLVVDISRYGAAWIRPGHIWAGRLAVSTQFTADYPFAAVAVIGQSLDHPGLTDVGAGISPHLPDATRRTLQELFTTHGWPAA